MELTTDQARAVAIARARAAAATSAPPVDPSAVTTRGAILPVGVTAGGDVVPAVPEFLVGPFQTISDLMSGKRTADQITGKEAFDLGSVFAGSGPMTKFPGLPSAGKAVSPVAAAGARIGVDVPRAASDGSVVTAAASNITSSVPFGGAPVRKAAAAAGEQLQTAAEDTQAELGTGNVRAAGSAIEGGLTSYAGKGGVLSQKVSAAYDKVDQLVNPDATGALPETAAVANRIDAERQAAGIAQPSKAVSLVLEAATRPEGLTYAGIKKLRGYIGEMVDNPSLIPADISQGEVKQIYGALSKDMEGVVKTAGGKDAVTAWEAANAEAANASAVRENLARVLKAPSEEAIFDKITAMAGTTSRGDVTTLGQARTAVGDRNWGEVLSAMVERWGFDEQGNFLPAQFVARWNKVTKDAKEVLFQTDAEKRQMQALDDIATVSAKANDLARLAEPKKGGVVKGALGLGGASALLGVSLSPWTAVIPILGSRVISNVLAKPEGAPAFATWAKAYVAFVSTPSMGTGAVLRKAGVALAYRVGIEEGLDAKAKGDLAARLGNAPAAQAAATKAKADQVQQGRREVLSQQTVY